MEFQDYLKVSGALEDCNIFVFCNVINRTPCLEFKKLKNGVKANKIVNSYICYGKNFSSY